MMNWLSGSKHGEARRLVNQLKDASKRERAGAELLRLGSEAAPALIEALQGLDALHNAKISLERLQSDSFYTVHASLWLKAADSRAIDAMMAKATDTYAAGISISPNSGRVDHDAAMRVFARKVSDDWVHLMVTADLEKTIWAQEAKSVLINELGIAP